MSEPEVLLALATFPEMETARRIADILVRERLAACVNLFPAVESVYSWSEKVATCAEVAAWIKTTPECYGALEARYRALHPYEVPALVAILVKAGLPDYCNWVAKSCGS
jgi:periplasmic divalent cation tolerance protein